MIRCVLCIIGLLLLLTSVQAVELYCQCSVNDLAVRDHVACERGTHISTIDLEALWAAQIESRQMNRQAMLERVRKQGGDIDSFMISEFDWFFAYIIPEHQYYTYLAEQWVAVAGADSAPRLQKYLLLLNYVTFALRHGESIDKDRFQAWRGSVDAEAFSRLYGLLAEAYFTSIDLHGVREDVRREHLVKCLLVDGPRVPDAVLANYLQRYQVNIDIDTLLGLCRGASLRDDITLSVEHLLVQSGLLGSTAKTRAVLATHNRCVFNASLRALASGHGDIGEAGDAILSSGEFGVNREYLAILGQYVGLLPMSVMDARRWGRGVALLEKALDESDLVAVESGIKEQSTLTAPIDVFADLAIMLHQHRARDADPVATVAFVSRLDQLIRLAETCALHGVWTESAAVALSLKRIRSTYDR